MNDTIKTIFVIIIIIVCFRLTQGLLGIYHNGNYNSYGYFGDE